MPVPPAVPGQTFSSAGQKASFISRDALIGAMNVWVLGLAIYDLKQQAMRSVLLVFIGSYGRPNDEGCVQPA